MQLHKRKKRLILHVKTMIGKLAKDLEIGPCDVTYVFQRLHSEGLPFITKILPLFSKFAIRCCSEQRVLPRSSLTNFSWKGRAPRFMRGLLERAISGCPVALRSIRQFCDYFYKTAFGFEVQQLKSAEHEYVSVDLELENKSHVVWETQRFRGEMRRFLHVLLPRTANARDTDVFSHVRPHDGPGSFAGSSRVKTELGMPIEISKKLPGNRIGSFDGAGKPYSGYYRSYPSAKETISLCGTHRRLGGIKSSSADYTAELAFVPKDSRRPRSISKEPYFKMKAQMSFSGFFSKLLSEESNGRINFADQTVNQVLAKESSIDRSFATLDLKDASDRVSFSLVSHLFQHTNALRIFATRFRSTHVSLPSGKIHRLRKFANMGSGMCFPVLALVVFLSAVTSIHELTQLPVKQVAKFVYVYGDDLIVPTKYAEYAVRGLEKAGLLVNQDKSFTRGYFRESCGADYYHGVDVAPVRLKLSGESLDSVSNYRNSCIPLCDDRGILQLERHCRELVDAGLFSTARYLYKTLQKKYALPSVARESVCLGIYDPLGLVGLEPNSPHEGGYVPVPVYATSDEMCPYKLMAASLKGSSQGTDPYLIPLRYSIRLKKRRVLETVTLKPYGLGNNPNEVLNLGSNRTFTSGSN